ncbi:MAG: dioxygenase [Nannocystaceae bacterium]|nr:dioxygenase [Nannocystaceae bacterium]
MHHRRSFLSGAASLTLGGCARPNEQHVAMTDIALPTLFVPHGGGPWTIVDLGMRDTYAPLRGYLATMADSLPRPPRAILCVSAHWEQDVPTVQSSPRPPMLYDYGGFPPEAYTYQWNAPGDPEAAALVQDHLGAAGFKTESDDRRGFDHGAFVPLMVPFPDATVPTFQVSLLASLDPRQHLAMGRALAPLRKQGILIVGSGMSYHNMRGFGASVRGDAAAQRQVADDSKAFDDWMAQTALAAPSERAQRLAEWTKAPAARASHPREEHLLPLMVAAGAAQEDAAVITLQTQLMHAHVSAVQFG